MTVKAAVRSMVEAAPLKFFDAAPPTTTKTPYVIAYFDGAPRGSEREADALERRDHNFQTVVVGTSIEQVDAARERLADVLEGKRPTVAGRVSSRILRTGSQLTRPDPELADRTLYIATDQWRAVSDPA